MRSILLVTAALIAVLGGGALLYLLADQDAPVPAPPSGNTKAGDGGPRAESQPAQSSAELSTAPAVPSKQIRQAKDSDSKEEAFAKAESTEKPGSTGLHLQVSSNDPRALPPYWIEVEPSSDVEGYGENWAEGPTDEAGEVEFEDLSPGTYEVKVSFAKARDAEEINEELQQRENFRRLIEQQGLDMEPLGLAADPFQGPTRFEKGAPLDARQVAIPSGSMLHVEIRLDAASQCSITGTIRGRSVQEGVKYRVFRATKGWNDELLMASSEFPVEEDGTFRIFPIDCDEATLVVDVETSFLSKTVATRSLGNLQLGEERHVTIDLPPLDIQEIEFMARSRATGQPITEWGLGWAPTNAPHGRSGWSRIESAEGRASLRVPEGDYRFEATADGYLPPANQEVSVPLSQDPPRVLFLLEPTQTYRIRLVDDQGRRLPNVRFELFSMDSPKRVTRELGPHQHVHLKANASGSTDRNGELDVSQVPPGWYYGKIVEYGKSISTDGTRTFADIEWDQIRERDLRVHLVPQGGLIEVTIEQ